MGLLQSRRNLLILIGIGLVLIISLIAFLLFQRPAKTLETSYTPTPTTTKAQNPDEPPLLLKTIGVNLGAFDPKTSMAGDFRFTKSRLQFDRLFMPYGFVIPGSVASTGKDKANPQPTFILPLGTKVVSLVDGFVADVSKVWSGDFSVQVTADGKMNKWVYEVEHVVNPVVKKGDKVTAGQVLAEVSRFDEGTPVGYGVVEIGILKGGNPPQHICPFQYLDSSIKEDMFQKIKTFYTDWEIYKGNTSLYSNEEVPGCATLEPIDG